MQRLNNMTVRDPNKPEDVMEEPNSSIDTIDHFFILSGNVHIDLLIISGDREFRLHNKNIQLYYSAKNRDRNIRFQVS